MRKNCNFGDECIFNCFVDCIEKDKCHKCGWNPKVQKARIEKIKMEKEVKNNE